MATTQKPAAAKATKKQIFSAKINKLCDEGNTKAYASVNVSGVMAIHGIRVMESKNGLFVSMPANSYIDSHGDTKYNEICHPITAEARTALIDSVMGAYNNVLDEQEDETEDEAEDESEDVGMSPP